MRVQVYKARRLLTLTDGNATLLRARVALGREPVGAKCREGDGRTPEGVYRICLVKENGKFGRSLGLSYPNAEDARQAYAQGVIDEAALRAVEAAEGRRPPWGTALGGEIYLHEGRVDTDWTQGCIALAPEDMAILFSCRDQIEAVEITP